MENIDNHSLPPLEGDPAAEIDAIFDQMMTEREKMIVRIKPELWRDALGLAEKGKNLVEVGLAAR